MSIPSIAERVAAGVAWLDENVPGWVERIDLEWLNLEGCGTCVLGQLFGDYFDAINEACIEGPPLGFNLPDAHDSSYAELTAEWVRVIEERRAQTAGATS